MRHRGIVIDHVDSATLMNATFHVQPAGRARCLVEKVKNVHAYISGELAGDADRPARKVSYNPYRSASFTYEDGKPCRSSDVVHLDEVGKCFSN